MKELFGRDKAIVAMIHVGALPGTPRSGTDVGRLCQQAAREAELYTRAGVDGLMIENMHDVPYLCEQVGPEIVASMTAVGLAVRAASDRPLGVQVLAAANREALAVAQACGAAFVRVENFAYAHVADEGLMATAQAGPLLRYRRQIGAQHVRIIADVKKKHSSHAITADVDLVEAARTAEFCGAEGIVVTGSATGRPTDPDELRAVRSAVGVPVWVGSGVTPDNLPLLWPHADVLIVGSYFKREGRWFNEPDARRVERLLAAAAELGHQK